MLEPIPAVNGRGAGIYPGLVARGKIWFSKVVLVDIAFYTSFKFILSFIKLLKANGILHETYIMPQTQTCFQCKLKLSFQTWPSLPAYLICFEDTAWSLRRTTTTLEERRQFVTSSHCTNYGSYWFLCWEAPFPRSSRCEKKRINSDNPSLSSLMWGTILPVINVSGIDHLCILSHLSKYNTFVQDALLHIC